MEDRTTQTQIKEIVFFKRQGDQIIEDCKAVSIQDADEILREIAKELPTKGFEKVNYKICWNDGKWHRGYIPLRFLHQHTDMIFSPMVAAQLMVAAGIRRPSNLSSSEYISYLREKNERWPDYSEHARKFFCEYVW